MNEEHASPNPVIFMKTIISYFKDHYQKDVDLKLYLLVGLFWAIALIFNYQLDFEDSVIDSYNRNPIIFLWYFLFYAYAYFGTVFIMIFYKRDWIWLRNWKFWIVSVVGLMILALDIAFYHDLDIVQYFFPLEIHLYARRCFDRVVSLFTNVLPLFILWKILKQPKNHFYGLRIKGANLKPYLWMILAISPLLLWASFQPDFLRQYPTYRAYGAPAYLEVSNWVTIFIYEICYGIDFISIELFFRGFLVIGIGSLIGKKALLPMVVVYSFIHFGKPMGEAISSVFGGYILGVIAFYSRHIFGGLIVHLGVAWLMDFFALLQVYVWR